MIFIAIAAALVASGIIPTISLAADNSVPAEKPWVFKVMSKAGGQIIIIFTPEEQVKFEKLKAARLRFLRALAQKR